MALYVILTQVDVIRVLSSRCVMVLIESSEKLVWSSEMMQYACCV